MPTSSRRIVSIVSLTRPFNSFMTGSAVVVGQAIALGGSVRLPESILGFLVAMSMMASTMALNDVVDLEIDRINNPRRPLPSGSLSKKDAYTLSIILIVVSLVAAAPLNFPWGLAVAALALALMLYYNFAGKKRGLTGNFVVSFNVALPFVYGGVIVSDIKPILVAFSAIAFLANVGREIVKGIADAAGDAARGVRTLAVMVGNHRAAIFSIVFFSSAVALSLIPPLLSPPIVGPLYLPPLAASVAGFIYSMYYLDNDSSASSAIRVKRQVLIWMLFGLLAFLLGSVSL